MQVEMYERITKKRFKKNAKMEEKICNIHSSFFIFPKMVWLHRLLFLITMRVRAHFRSTSINPIGLEANIQVNPLMAPGLKMVTSGSKPKKNQLSFPLA